MTKITKKRSHPDLLMETVSRWQQNRPEAEEAYRKLYTMYAPFIRELCRKFNGFYQIKEQGIWQEVAGNVLSLIWEKAGTYKPKLEANTGLRTIAKADIQIRTWLKAIARNEFFKYMREKRSKETYFSNSEELFEIKELKPYLSAEIVDHLHDLQSDRMIIMTSISQSEVSPKTGEFRWKTDLLPDIADDNEGEDEKAANYDAWLKKYALELKETERLLSKMTEKKREVYMTYVLHQDENDRIPPEMHQGLCDKFGLHKEYPKKIKKRVEAELQKKLHQKFGLLLNEEETFIE